MNLSRICLIANEFQVAVLVAICVAPGACVLMPGDRGGESRAVKAASDVPLAQELRIDVEHLAGRIGERTLMVASSRGEADRTSLHDAEEYLALELARAGLRVKWQTYEVECPGGRIRKASNLEVEIQGSEKPDEILVVGAHYDTVHVDDVIHGSVRTPGADDNASGCAAVLALARSFAVRSARGETFVRTIRFVLFANEEPPFFWTDQMGSLVYARACKERGDKIVGMMSLETIGMYTDAPGSQGRPALMGDVVPDRGDFIAFVGMTSAEGFVRECVEAFRAGSSFPCEGAALPMAVPRIGSSDHWSFWKVGYPAVMVTDTAKYRNPNYHKGTDTVETLHYEAMAEVVRGLENVAEKFATNQIE